MSVDLVASDTGSQLSITCVDKETNLPVDLTGATVYLNFRVNGGNLSQKVMTITSPATSGVATYLFQSSDLVTGFMVGEVQINKANGNIITSAPTFQLMVRSKI